MRRACVVLLGSAAVAASGCAGLVPAPAVDPGPDPLGGWARVLHRHVDDSGRVDFAALAGDRAELDRYVASLHASGPNSAPERFPTRAHVLAHHLNAYNALAMFNVLERGVPRSLGGIELARFFYLRRFSIDGAPLSLYAYENDVIRPLGEERMHFALNCMAASCPRLPRAPFRAGTLEAQLEGEARRFLNEPRNVRVDEANRVVTLSAILDFYTEDFLAKAPSLIAYVNRYRHAPIPADYRVEFLPYDWTVNAQPR